MDTCLDELTAHIGLGELYGYRNIRQIRMRVGGTLQHDTYQSGLQRLLPGHFCRRPREATKTGDLSPINGHANICRPFVASDELCRQTKGLFKDCPHIVWGASWRSRPQFY